MRTGKANKKEHAIISPHLYEYSPTNIPTMPTGRVLILSELVKVRTYIYSSQDCIKVKNPVAKIPGGNQRNHNPYHCSQTRTTIDLS